LVALLMVPLVAMIALAIDLGYIALTRTQLQAAADSAALAAATEVVTNYPPNQQDPSRTAAQRLAEANRAGDRQVRLDPDADVELGYWDANTREFLAPRLGDANLKVNAVRVRTHRDATNANGPLPLFFARVLGINSWNVAAEAIAFVPNPVATRDIPNPATRFLIDDEMLDTDEPSIINLAQQRGVTPEYLLRAKNETSADTRDWFLNLPAGAQLEVPTGQVGDEGLLDIAANFGNPNLPQYPFTGADHVKFLKYNETSESDPISQMRNSILSKSQLDPLPGVGRFNQPSRYPELVNPNFVHVSPVWKSDVSALDGVDKADEKSGPDLNGDGKVDGYTTNKPTEKGVNALGYRRGLLAFKIIGYRVDPARPYPYLPNLIIEIVDPATIDLDSMLPVTDSRITFKSGGVQTVRLAR
jgi:hypothetical protein